MNQQENREIRISPDALIALVVAEAEDRELSAMPSLEEMNAAFHPSEEFQKKMDRLLKQAKRKQERKGAWRATKRLFVVATTVVTAFACILMPVQAVQEAVVSTVLNWRDQFVEILYSKEDDPNAVILLQNVELTYLPEGFTETPSNRTSNTSFWNEYQSENGEWLTVRILPIQDKQSTFVDDEYTHYYQISFDGCCIYPLSDLLLLSHMVWRICCLDCAGSETQSPFVLQMKLYFHPHLANEVRTFASIFFLRHTFL